MFACHVCQTFGNRCVHLPLTWVCDGRERMATSVWNRGEHSSGHRRPKPRLGPLSETLRHCCLSVVCHLHYEGHQEGGEREVSDGGCGSDACGCVGRWLRAGDARIRVALCALEVLGGPDGVPCS